jgi:WD40 repeat protein
VTRLPWQPWGTLCCTLVCFSATPTWFYYKVCISIVRSWTAQQCRTWNINTHCKWCLMFSLSDPLSAIRWTSSQGGISCVCFVPNDLICCAWSKKQCKTHSVYWALPPQGQWLTHSIQLLEVLLYWNRIFSVKVFRLFRLKRIFFGVQSVDKVGRCTTSDLLAGPACLWCLVEKWFSWKHVELTVEKPHETLVSRINRIKEMPAGSRLVESMQRLERVNMSTTT